MVIHTVGHDSHTKFISIPTQFYSTYVNDNLTYIAAYGAFIYMSHYSCSPHIPV